MHQHIPNFDFVQGGLGSGYKKFVEEKGLADETYSKDGVALFEISGTSLHDNKAIQVDEVWIIHCLLFQC